MRWNKIIMIVFSLAIVTVWPCYQMSWAFESVPVNPKALSLAHYIMGIHYDLYGQAEKAVSEYKLSIKYDDHVAASHMRVGMNLAKMGNYPDSAGHLQKAVDLDPENLQAHYFLALIFSSQKDFSRAAGQYEAILKKLAVEDPRNVELFIYLGQLYYSQGMIEKAVEQFEKVLTLDRVNTSAIYLVSTYYLDHGRMPEAIELLKRCIEADPLDDACLNSLGYTYAENGYELDEALSLIKRAIEVEPSNGAYLDSLGWVYYRKGMYTEALKELLRASEMVNDPVVYDHLGDVYLKLGQPEMSRKYWRQSLELDTEQPEVRIKLEDLEKDQASNLK